DPGARAVPLGPALPDRACDRLVRARARLGPALDASTGEPQGPGAARRGLGAGPADPVGDLRVGPRDDLGPVLVLLLAARIDAVRPRPRGGRRAPRRRRRPLGRHAGRARARAELRRARPRALRELRLGRHRAVRSRHGRARLARPADRLLRRHRGRLEPPVRRPPLAAPPRPGRAVRQARGADRAALGRDPRGAPRASRAERGGPADRGRDGRAAGPARAEGARATRPDHGRGQARSAARVGGGVRRDGGGLALGGRRRGPALDARDEAPARAWPELPARRGRRGDRLRRLPEQGADLTPLWFRELELVGAYTGGIETVGKQRRHAFDVATELAGSWPLDGMVGATYPLRRWREAIDHALAAGKLGTLKVA